MYDNPGGTVEIAAPVAGMVLRVMQESRTVVGPGTPLIEIGDPGNLEVELMFSPLMR